MVLYKEVSSICNITHFFSKRENIILKMWGKLVNKKISQPAAGFFSWAGCEIAKTNIILYQFFLCGIFV